MGGSGNLAATQDKPGRQVLLLINPATTNLEGSASSFSLSLPSKYGGDFRLYPGRSWGSLWTNKHINISFHCVSQRRKHKRHSLRANVRNKREILQRESETAWRVQITGNNSIKTTLSQKSQSIEAIIPIKNVLKRKKKRKVKQTLRIYTKGNRSLVKMVISRHWAHCRGIGLSYTQEKYKYREMLSWR